MYYDGTKLLSLKDIDGRDPELYICTSNRTGGKTTYFNRMTVNRCRNKRQKVALLTRYSYSLDDIEEAFFKDVHELFFPTYKIEAEKHSKGTYKTLTLNGVPMGYAFSLNSADFIKEKSHLFTDINFMLMDEFQSETNKYVPDEIHKFLSIHKSVARGHGKQVRHVPVYMIGNDVSLINPYYTELGISSRLNSSTQFLRGKGFVLEHSYIDSAAKAQEESGISRAFSGNSYIDYTVNQKYLNDSFSFIERPSGRCRYLCTLKYKGKSFSVKEYSSLGILYCDTQVDENFPTKICVTTEDHNVNYVMLKNNSLFISNLRYFFEKGAFRFKDLNCKECLMRTISY